MFFARQFFSSRSVEQLLFAAMAPQRRSMRLQATTSSSSIPLSAVKKEKLAGKKTAIMKASALTTPREAAAAKKEEEKAPAPAASKRAPQKKPAATATAPRAKKTAGGGPTREMEQQLWRQGCSFVVGVDEAGRGPLAGPVVAAAAVLPRDGTGLPSIIRLDDSKKMTEEEREAAFEALEAASRDFERTGVAFAFCVLPPSLVDEVNILEATMLAMDRAVQELSEKLRGGGQGGTEGSSPGALPLAVLVDGNRLPPRLLAAQQQQQQQQTSESSKFLARAVVKGDAKITAIAAASVVAKVTRDRLMRAAAEKWPRYGFDTHKGYGTTAHVAAIRKYGPCEIHRRSFEPIKSLVGWTRGEMGSEE